MEEKALGKFTISGLVQGVGFRFFVYQKANSLGLKGYAKNLFNGEVEVVAEGAKPAVEELHRHLKRGPSRASVDFVKANFSDFTGAYSSFSIK